MKKYVATFRGLFWYFGKFLNLLWQKNPNVVVNDKILNNPQDIWLHSLGMTKKHVMKNCRFENYDRSMFINHFDNRYVKYFSTQREEKESKIAEQFLHLNLQEPMSSRNFRVA